MKKYRVILKGGKEQLITARNAKEACKKVKELLPRYEIIGYYEV